MTSVVVWINRENPQEFEPTVWAASDSRLTGDKEKPLSDAVPKLFEVPIKIHINRSRLQQIAISSLGFAYAGSSFIAQTCLSKLSSKLGYLSPLDEANFNFHKCYELLPKLHDVAALLRDIQQVALSDLGNYRFLSKSEVSLATEICLFGYCFIQKGFFCFHLRNEQGNVSEIVMETVDLDSSRYFLMGDRKDDVAQSIEEAYDKFEKDSLKWWRSPAFGLQRLLDDGDYQTIGGNLQLAISRRGFTRVEHVVEDVPRFTEELRVLGGYFTTPNAMSLK